jgi:hypothetical protein
MRNHFRWKEDTEFTFTDQGSTKPGTAMMVNKPGKGYVQAVLLKKNLDASLYNTFQTTGLLSPKSTANL